MTGLSPRWRLSYDAASLVVNDREGLLAGGLPQSVLQILIEIHPTILYEHGMLNRLKLEASSD